MTIREDVSRFEQFVVPEPTNGAALAVGLQNTQAEALLVQTPLR